MNFTKTTILKKLETAGIPRSWRQLERDFLALDIRPNALPKKPRRWSSAALAPLWRHLGLLESDLRPQPRRVPRLLTVAQAKRKAGR